MNSFPWSTRRAVRDFGSRCVLTTSDIEARFGSKAKSGQVLGNLNNLFVLRVKNEETASVLADQLPKVKVQHLIPVSGTSDINNSGDASEFVPQRR